MPKRLPVHGLDPEGNPDGKVVGLSGGKPAWIDGGSSIGGLPELDIVTDFGAAVDGDGSGGGTDDTTAVQNALDEAGALGGAKIISSRLGICNIAGALQATGTSNAQLLLPAVDYGDSETVPIVIEGGLPPGSVVAVGSTTPPPVHQLVFQSFLTSGEGGALLGGQGPVGTSESFTNVDLYLRKATFRMPSNPVLTALNLLKVACADLDNVIVDAGSYSVPSISVPTTSTSYGIKLPDLDNGAHTRLGRVDVVGFYNGLLYNEHTLGEYVAAWACKIAHTFAAGFHDSGFTRLAYYHCQTGLKFTGDHYVTIDRLNIEHAASGTWAPSYDIDDASNHGHGKVKYHIVKAGVGFSDADWTVNGATGITASAVGTEPAAGTTIYKGRDTLTAASGDDTLTLGATPVDNSPLVWVNGDIVWPVTDYTITGTVITFNSALAASDVVLVIYDTTNASPVASVLSTAGGAYVADDFNRADSSSSLGSTSTGSAAWTAVIDTWGISSNQAYKASGSSTGIAVVESGHGDCTVSATLAAGISTSNTGIVFRYQDSGNHWVLEGGNGSTQAALYKKTGGGSYTSIATSAGNVHFTNGDVISVILSGSSITVKQNGTTIITTTDSAFSTATKHGLHISGNDNTARFDDFSVTP
jgi:hypothetical protein